MTSEKKINAGITIGICVGAGLVAVVHPDCGIRGVLTFVVLAIFEWWYVRKLIKESDEPKPDWYPLKIVLAVGVALLLFACMGNGCSHGTGRATDYNDDEGDPQWGR